MEHSEHFVSPQPYKLGGGGEAGRASQQEALGHSRQVTQVEDVVEAGWSRGQLLYDVVIQIQSQACQTSSHACLQQIACCEKCSEQGLECRHSSMV